MLAVGVGVTNRGLYVCSDDRYNHNQLCNNADRGSNKNIMVQWW